MVAAHQLGDVGEVAGTRARDDLPAVAGGLAGDDGQEAVAHDEALARELRAQLLVERGDAVVVEAGGDGAEHRHVLGRVVEPLTVAHHLAAHGTQRVVGATTLELVDRHHIGEVEHVDLLELRGRAVLGRHHEQRDVGELGDRGVALADAGRLHDHEVGTPRRAGRDGVGQARRDLGGGVTRGQRPEVHVRRVDRVHADAVAEERTATAATGGVDRDDRDAELVLLVDAEAAHQLVGERRLARTPGAGDAEHGHTAADGGAAQLVARAVVDRAELQRGDGAGQRERGAGGQLLDRWRPLRHQIGGRLLEHLVDHPLETDGPAIVGREHLGHAARLEQLDLVAHDDPATARVDVHVTEPLLAEALHEVGEVLHVAALVGADGDAVHVFFERGTHHLVDRAVVAEVDHFGAAGLEDAADDVDRGVVTVEEAGGGDEAAGTGGGVGAHWMYDSWSSN